MVREPRMIDEYMYQVWLRAEAKKETYCRLFTPRKWHIKFHTLGNLRLSIHPYLPTMYSSTYLPR